jgi:phosphoribosylformimino-5-aminoimidazole carboxamide ribotide isomerase
VARIAAALAGRCRLQTGGGVRAPVDVEALAVAGVARVVMGSAAVREPALVDVASAIMPVAVGLDHRRGELAVHGWTEGSGIRLAEALRSFPSAAAFVITDIARDGMLVGPDVDGLTEAATSTQIPVIASGGVASLADLAALAAVPGLAGVITGKALYEGRFTVTEALAQLERSRASE